LTDSDFKYDLQQYLIVTYFPFFLNMEIKWEVV